MLSMLITSCSDVSPNLDTRVQSQSYQSFFSHIFVKRHIVPSF